MTDVGELALPLLLTAFAFAPITAFVARSRDRGPLIWFVLGALLGPIALVLLAFAPPGRCESCGWQVAGWPSDCAVCGAPLGTPSSRQEGSPAAAPPVAVGASLTPAVPDELLSIVRPFPPSTDDDSDRPATVATRARPSRAKATASVSVGERPTAASRVGATRPIGPVAANAVSRNGVDRSNEKVILATALFLTGSSSCQPGMHYALAIRAGSLLVIGPLERSRDAVVVERPLGSIEVAARQDRLLIKRRPAGVRIWSLAFGQLSGQSAESVELALVNAGSARGWSE